MKAKWALVFLAASAFGAVCQQATAQVAGEQPIGVSVEQTQLIVEGWDIVRLAAADQVAVYHHLLIHPLAPGVADVGL